MWFWATSENAWNTVGKLTSSIFIFSFMGYFWTVFEEGAAWVIAGLVSSRYGSGTRGQAWITKVCQHFIAFKGNKCVAVHTTVVQSIYSTDCIFNKNKPLCISLKHSRVIHIKFYILYFCKTLKNKLFQFQRCNILFIFTHNILIQMNLLFKDVNCPLNIYSIWQFFFF